MSASPKRAQLRSLLEEWDPIGVYDPVAGFPDDEYNCLIDPLLRRLDDGEGEGAITRFLQGELRDHFGLDPRHAQPGVFARRVVEWYAAGEPRGAPGGELPFVDEHSVVTARPRPQVFAALERYVERSLGSNPWPKAGFTWVLGTRPAAGFGVVERVKPDRLVLAGRHRFSRYRLTFELEDGPGEGETTVRALSHAEFPGLHGKAYRAAVVGTGLHVVATNRILGAIRRSAEPTST
jgi:hypothetical protein